MSYLVNKTVIQKSTTTQICKQKKLKGSSNIFTEIKSGRSNG